MNLFEAQKLIRHAQRGDAENLSRLLACYRNYLRVLAQVWLPSDLPAKLDPSDLVQEALLKAHQGFGQFAGQSEVELTAWLRKILSRCVVDVVREYRTAARDIHREQRLENSLDQSAAALNRLMGGKPSSPSQHALRREQGVVLANAMAEMPDELRQVITLRSLQELRWAEVAKRMNRPISTVRDLWVQSLTDLRKRIDGAI